MDQWYFQRQGQRYGPCTLEKLKRVAAAGKFDSDDLVRCPGMYEWVPAQNVPELSDALAQAQQAAPAASPEPAKPVAAAPPAPAPAIAPLPAPAPASAPQIQVSLPPVPPPAPPPLAAPSAAELKDAPVAVPRRPPGFVSALQGRLPKPILFGLYGAVGALLGLLLLGEILFFFLHPPKLKPEVKLAVATDLVVFTGSENKLAVQIARHGFRGPVTISAANVTKDIQIADVTLPEGVDEAELDVKASPEATPSDSYVQLNITAKDVPPAAGGFQLKVTAVPPTLQAAISPAVAVYAGDRNRFTVKIARERFEGPIRLEVLDLPPEIQIPMIALPENVTEATLDVSVAKTAVPRVHNLLLETRSLANHKVRSTETLRLQIEPPPGKLQLAVASLVTVFPGEKNKFTVRIARQDFTAPVQLEFEGLPEEAGVRLESVTIPPEKTEAELEVVATPSAATATHQLRLKAKALNAEDLTASLPLQLKVAPPPPLLQLAVSPKVSVYPGSKARFGVKIVRQRFDSPVRIDLQDTTGFLSAPALIIPADQTDGELEITAALTALSARPRLPHTDFVNAIARSQDDRGANATERVQVEILAPPSGLELSVSPEVESFQGGKFRFTVKAARAGFVGPIQLQFTGLPDGIAIESTTAIKGRPRTATGASIPANVNEVVLEGKTSLRTVPKKYPIQLQGTGPTAPDGKTPAKTVEFSLHVKALEASKRPPPIDAIFVLDATETMRSEINGLRDGIVQFLGEMKSSELDARVGVVTFRDVVFENKPPQVIKFNGETFTSDPKVFSTEVGKIEVASGGDDPESSLEGLALAAQQPFRERALRVLLLITDAEPQTKGNSLPMDKALALLKEKKIDQIHLIVAAKDRGKYAPLQQQAKGSVFDIVQASRMGKGFAALLPELSKGIADTIEAAGPATPVAGAPPAPPKPADPAAIASEKPPPPKAATPPAPPPVPTPPPPVAGIVAAPQVAVPQPPVPKVPAPPKAAEASGLKGLQSTQVFSEKDRFQLLAAIALWTAALAGGIGLALVTGQKLYLHQSWPRRAEMGKAVVAGLAAGLLGGLVSQWFFQSTAAATDSGSLVARLGEILSRVLAWALLGGLLGAGMSVFVPNLKWQRGFTGGFVGGILGALGFALFTALAGPVLGRWIGAALLGFAIGMMIALAEMAFRRYWLEVKFGQREIRTFTLGPSLVAVGGDDKVSTVCVRDAPARALGYTVRGSRVLCEDFTTGTTSDVPPGDQRKLANALLTVRSDANATPTGASLQLLQTREVALMEGMPLTLDDLPGLEPQGSDGVVALVSRRPADPNVLLLRNRSKQTWTVKDAGGERTITPGMSAELSSRCQINFGQVKGTLEFGQASKESPAARP